MPSLHSDPPGMAYGFRDLVDLPAFAGMLESFYRATGIPNGIVDADGELLALSGTRACAEFHRAAPLSAERCRQSNLAIMRDLRAGAIAGGLCLNGLMDYATPVVIEDRPVATLFLGQVLHAPPDIEFFRAQALEFGYDESAYLEAIAAIPVVDRERLQQLMEVMVQMARMLAAGGLARLRENALKRDLSSSTERRIQLEDILDSSPVAIGWSAADGRIEYINRQFTRLFGYSIEDLPDLETWYRLAYPDDHYRKTVVYPWCDAVADPGRAGALPELESNITCKDGATRRVVVRVSWVGQRRLVNIADITDRWISEQRKYAHEAMLEMVARGVGLNHILNALVQQVEREDRSALCSILLLDGSGRRLFTGAAPSLPEFYNEAINGLEIGMGVGSCGTAAHLGQRVVVADIHTHPYWQPYVALAASAGVRACWSEPILSSQGEVLGTFAIYHRVVKAASPEDIERIAFAANLAAIAIENRRAHEELERRAYADYLTGLANRRRFFEQAEHELGRAARYGKKLSVLMLDVDHFKRVNDSYGHEAGDLVLQRLAHICRTTLRAVDTTGRIGGEEFAVLLPETGLQEAVQVAERLRSEVAAEAVALKSGATVRFTVSVGAATLENEAINVDGLLSQADAALYQAKMAGRNKVFSAR